MNIKEEKIGKKGTQKLQSVPEELFLPVSKMSFVVPAQQRRTHIRAGDGLAWVHFLASPSTNSASLGKLLHLSGIVPSRAEHNAIYLSDIL